MKKTYTGQRNRGTRNTVWVDAGHIVYDLPTRTDLRNHSPDGFEWGYGGSGPAQLALAVLCDALQDETEAQCLYQDFKRDVIAGLDRDTWVLSVEDVLQWVLDHRPETVIDPRHQPMRN